MLYLLGRGGGESEGLPLPNSSGWRGVWGETSSLYGFSRHPLPRRDTLSGEGHSPPAEVAETWSHPLPLSTPGRYWGTVAEPRVCTTRDAVSVCLQVCTVVDTGRDRLCVLMLAAVARL